MSAKRKNAKSSKDPLLTILIPVYNEEKTLAKILKKTAVLPIDTYEIIVVDDASKDRSPEIINDFLNSFVRDGVDVRLFTHPKNKGKGAGIQTALKHAKGEYFIIQDADLEYDPKDIPSILEEAQVHGYDAVYGSRFLGTIQGMPKANYLANRGYNTILRILYKTNVTDMHTCHKMVRTSLIKKLGITSNGFDYATELISKLLKSGVNIHEVPISFNGRTKKEGKKIDVMDGIECAYKLLRFRFSKDDRLFSEKSTTFARFLIVGATGFIVNYIVLVALTHIVKLGHVTAEIFAILVALQVTFILHDRWTYQLRAPSVATKLKLISRYIAYLISNAFGSFMTVLAFSILYNHMNRLPALLISATAGVVWNYFMNTYIIWRRTSKAY
jgi:glycosyltransferase involved in cell wall biosynthesis